MNKTDYILAIAMMLVLGFVSTYTLWRMEAQIAISNRNNEALHTLQSTVEQTCH